jgi:hypothetical protein
MRTAILVIALSVIAFGLSRDGIPPNKAASPTASTPAPARVDFDYDVKPILQSKCMPCHFSGGKMYDQLPFDRPETVRKLGERLFTRIHDDKHRRVIQEFLTQDP